MVDSRFKRCRDKKRQTFLGLREQAARHEQRLSAARAEILELQSLLAQANEEKGQADEAVVQIHFFN